MDFVFIPNKAFCTIISEYFMHKDEDFEVFNQTALDFKRFVFIFAAKRFRFSVRAVSTVRPQ